MFEQPERILPAGLKQPAQKEEDCHRAYHRARKGQHALFSRISFLSNFKILRAFEHALDCPEEHDGREYERLRLNKQPGQIAEHAQGVSALDKIIYGQHNKEEEHRIHLAPACAVDYNGGIEDIYGRQAGARAHAHFF